MGCVSDGSSGQISGSVLAKQFINPASTVSPSTAHLRTQHRGEKRAWNVGQYHPRTQPSKLPPPPPAYKRRTDGYEAMAVPLTSITFMLVKYGPCSLVPSPSHPSFCLTAVEKKLFFSTAAREKLRWEGLGTRLWTMYMYVLSKNKNRFLPNCMRINTACI